MRLTARHSFLTTAFAMALTLMLSLNALALPADAEQTPTPLSEAQAAIAEELFSSLYCVVCSGQSLAESDASLAVDIKKHIRSELASGKDAPAIKAALVQSYGEQILMEPPVRTGTLPLWLAPLILLLLGGTIVYFSFFARRPASSQTHQEPNDHA